MENLIAETDPAAGLSISELADRTGVPAATLRSWEARYGAPRPQRLAGGHRRYDDADVALVQEILRQRSAGLSLRTAISRARTRASEPEASVFAGLRRRHPDLLPQVLRKATLLALTRAMEDECCARAEQPLLFASFQRQRFFDQSRLRWAELARTATAVVVLADFARQPVPGAALLKVPVPADAPIRREWVLVCDAPDYPACLAGWEHPGQDRIADVDRHFETLWTVDPRTVRDAARICSQLARRFAPGLGRRLPDPPPGAPPVASADLRRAAGLLTRTLGYLDGTRRR